MVVFVLLLDVRLVGDSRELKQEEEEEEKKRTRTRTREPGKVERKAGER